MGPTNAPGPGAVSKNHQVLSIGYRYNNGTKEVEINVYDSNHPNKTSKISMNIGIPKNQLKAKQTTPCIHAKSKIATCTEKVRGFFVNPIGSGPPKVSKKGTSSKASPLKSTSTTGRRKVMRK